MKCEYVELFLHSIEVDSACFILVVSREVCVNGVIVPGLQYSWVLLYAISFCTVLL